MMGVATAETGGAADHPSTEQLDTSLTAAPSPCRCPLSWFDPDPRHAQAAFALIGEFNLLTDGCQADRVAHPLR